MLEIEREKRSVHGEPSPVEFSKDHTKRQQHEVIHIASYVVAS